MQKLESLDPSGSEYNVVKNYLDWMTLLPWGTHSEDSFDVSSHQLSPHAAVAQILTESAPIRYQLQRRCLTRSTMEWKI